LSLPADPIPAKGFKLVSGKRNPPDDGTKYEIQFRSGFVDRKNAYTAPQIRWLHRDPPCSFDVVAVRKVG